MLEKYTYTPVKVYTTINPLQAKWAQVRLKMAGVISEKAHTKRKHSAGYF